LSSETENKMANEKGGGQKKVLIGIVVAIIAVLIVTVIVLAGKLSKQADKKEVVSNQTKAIVTAEDAEDVLGLEEEAPTARIPMNYTVSQNSEWTFKDGSSPSTDAYVKNDASNETAVYFDLLLEDDTVIYSSPILELGAEISNFKLDKSLDAGVYDCVVLYHLIDENQNDLTTVHIGVTVIVEN